MRGAEWVRVRVVRWRRGVPGAQVALRLVLDVLLAQLVDADDLDSLDLRRRQLVLVLALRVLGEEDGVALAERACWVWQSEDVRLVLLARERLVASLGHLRADTHTAVLAACTPCARGVRADTCSACPGWLCANGAAPWSWS